MEPIPGADSSRLEGMEEGGSGRGEGEGEGVGVADEDTEVAVAIEEEEEAASGVEGASNEDDDKEGPTSRVVVEEPITRIEEEEETETV